MKPVRIQADDRAGGWTAKEVYKTTPADHCNGLLPRGGGSDGLDGDVNAAAAVSEIADGLDGVGSVVEADDLGGPEKAGGGDLVGAFHNGYDTEAVKRGDMEEHEPNRAGPEYGHGVARLGRRLGKATNNAGEGLGEGSVFELDIGGDMERVFLDDTGGDAQVLGVSAVIEEEIVAQVLLAFAAPEAGVTRG